MNSMRERKQVRLKNYDYSHPGAYFVTICTKDRQPRFGEIVNGEMRRNDLAAIVQTCWNDLPDHYPNVGLDAFVVMPNHVHGIVMIFEKSPVGDGLRPSPTGPSSIKNHPLSEIIRAFKSFSARRINEIRNTPGVSVWQRGYYDHIIRDGCSLERIRDYIIANPKRWSSDKQNRDNIRDDEFNRWMNSASKKPNYIGKQ